MRWMNASRRATGTRSHSTTAEGHPEVFDFYLDRRALAIIGLDTRLWKGACGCGRPGLESNHLKTGILQSQKAFTPLRQPQGNVGRADANCQSTCTGVSKAVKCTGTGATHDKPLFDQGFYPDWNPYEEKTLMLWNETLLLAGSAFILVAGKFPITM